MNEKLPTLETFSQKQTRPRVAMAILILTHVCSTEGKSWHTHFSRYIFLRQCSRTLEGNTVWFNLFLHIKTHTSHMVEARFAENICFCLPVFTPCNLFPLCIYTFFTFLSTHPVMLLQSAVVYFYTPFVSPLIAFAGKHKRAARLINPS